MDYMELNNAKVKISAMGIADFILGVTTKIKEGYELNYEDNDMYPIAYGGFFEVTMQKVSVQAEEATEVSVQVVQVPDVVKSEVSSKVGRKPKVEDKVTDISEDKS